MALENPIRGYRFRVEVDGVSQWAIQKVTLPEVSTTVLEHGGGDLSIKTASKKIVGEATFEKLVSINDTDSWGSDWLESCVTGLPSSYKRNIVVRLLDNDGITTVKTYILTGIFPTKLTRADLDRMADENFMETLTLSVDNITELNS